MEVAVGLGVFADKSRIDFSTTGRVPGFGRRIPLARICFRTSWRAALTPPFKPATDLWDSRSAFVSFSSCACRFQSGFRKESSFVLKLKMTVRRRISVIGWPEASSSCGGSLPFGSTIKAVVGYRRVDFEDFGGFGMSKPRRRR